MDVSLFCSDTLPNFLTTEILPITMIAAVLFSMIIGITFALSQATSNPKLSVWSKIEIMQLIFSTAFVLILLEIIASFCTFSTNDIAMLTGSSAPTPALPVYDGAEKYLVQSAAYSKVAMINARYYLGVINVQEMVSTWKCPDWCFLTVGGTGASASPNAGSSMFSSAFMLLLNSSLMSFMSSFMHIFFLKYIQSGLFLFLFPLAIITRSLPYLRTFGAVILAVIFAFYVIYPSILAAFYVSLSDSMVPPVMKNEDELKQKDFDFGAALWGDNPVKLSVSASDIGDVSNSAAKAFFYSVFLPTVALLATGAAATYVSRLMGEDIDLSRLTQMI
ncbi:MAG: hypothetical protein AB1391_01250 [Candidatus Micrarchaeota archaeon]